MLIVRLPGSGTLSRRNRGRDGRILNGLCGVWLVARKVINGLLIRGRILICLDGLCSGLLKTI